MNLEAILSIRKTGDEKIKSSNKTSSILEYWQWAYSDLIGNTERGCFAEYIVALACNVEDKVRIGWAPYDLILKNGIKVEVKSSAYLQSWKQNKYSKPIFGIQKTKAWDYIENTLDSDKKRQADIYVFALLAHKIKESLNPLDLNQWEFYILNTRQIDKEVKDLKQLSLEKIQILGALKSSFEDLYDNILVVYSNDHTP